VDLGLIFYGAAQNHVARSAGQVCRKGSLQDEDPVNVLCRALTPFEGGARFGRFEVRASSSDHG
jgi:hypothetical protein